MAARSGIGRSASSTAATANSNIRRNLFPSTNRRPATVVSSADSLQLCSEDAIGTSNGSSVDIKNDDIIVRDDSGDFVVEQPAPMPAAEPNDEADEVEEARIDTRLIDLYRSHSRQHIDPAGKFHAVPAANELQYLTLVQELRAAVQASLRQKAASLDDDKWMYEPADYSESQS